MRSKLSTVVRIRLRGVAGDGTGKTGVAYILTWYRVVVVVDGVGVVLLVGLAVTIHAGEVTVVDVLRMVDIPDVLALFVCQPIVDVLVVVVVDSVV